MLDCNGVDPEVVCQVRDRFSSIEALEDGLDTNPIALKYRLPESEPRVPQIRALVLGTALDWIADNTADPHHILGFPFTESGLQLGVEASLRALARLAPSQQHRYALVDMANTVRPMTTF